MDDFAGRFLGPRKRAPEHRAVAAEDERHRQRAVALDAAVGDQRHVGARLVDRHAAVDERLGLRHAKAGRHARGASAARADADLDSVDAALEQEPRAVGGADVARNQLDVAGVLAQLGDRAVHHLGMAVRDVDHQHVHAGLDELGRALEVVARGANRRARL